MKIEKKTNQIAIVSTLLILLSIIILYLMKGTDFIPDNGILNTIIGVLFILGIALLSQSILTRSSQSI